MSPWVQVLLGLLGSVLTAAIFMFGVIFRMGQQDARIEALEKHDGADHEARLVQLEEWRSNIRIDMHEISDLIHGVDKKLTTLTALVEERTERREQGRSA